ncbi:MAG TPA: phage Gp37/Gp68 family protein [Isosphaeraceae bacterium]|nr:phage Gp37/Gp68 family protein [Isosphaeraceae bacterium]
MGETNIAWTNRTWNPVRGRPHWTGRVRETPEKLAEPLSWKKPRMVFVNSMSDLFDYEITPEYIEQIFGVMAYCSRHTFQVLTKRAESMSVWFSRWLGSYDDPLTACLDRAGLAPGSPRSWPLPNVWLGVSVEDQRRADERIPHLLRTPAAVRFLSVEPMLGPVDLERSVPCGYYCDPEVGHVDHYPSLIGIDWVIVGGESGPGHRPMNLDWARSIRDQCRAAGVPFFFKQGSGPRPGMHAELDGEVIQEFPRAPRGVGV